MFVCLQHLSWGLVSLHTVTFLRILSFVNDMKFKKILFMEEFDMCDTAKWRLTYTHVLQVLFQILTFADLYCQILQPQFSIYLSDGYVNCMFMIIGFSWYSFGKHYLLKFILSLYCLYCIILPIVCVLHLVSPT